MARAIDTVLFDLDGTLIESIPLIRASYLHTLTVHRGGESDPELWLAGLGRPLRWHFGQMTSDPAEVEAMIATYREHNHAHHDAMVRAFPGAVEAVHALAAQGIKLGIVTSKLRKGAHKGLLHCGFGLEPFGAIIGMDDCVEHKPHPEPVHKALAQLGSAPERAVMVGDSPYDLMSGKSAGTATAAVAWGPFPRAQLDAVPPDRWLAHPQSIRELVL